MSHLARYGSKLKGINEDLLAATLKIVAKRHKGGKVGKTVDATSEGSNMKTWNGRPIIASLRTDDCKTGIGLVVETEGTVQFVADTYYNRAGFASIQKEIERTYTALAYAQALNSLGYAVATNTKGEVTVLRGQKS